MTKEDWIELRTDPVDVVYFCMFRICFAKCVDLHFPQNSEVNLEEIGPYIDYLTEKQGVNGIFGKFQRWSLKSVLSQPCYLVGLQTCRCVCPLVTMLTSLRGHKGAVSGRYVVCYTYQLVISLGLHLLR